MPEEYIAKIEKEILETTIKCFNCNVCYTVCPLDKTRSGFASDGPSGITQSIYYAVKWELLDKLSEEEKRHLMNLVYSCTTCNSCVLTCKDLGTGRDKIGRAHV